MKFYAQPCVSGARGTALTTVKTDSGVDIEGFYFHQFGELDEQMEKLRISEVIITIPEETLEEKQLAKVVNMYENSLKKTFDYIEMSDKKTWPAVFYLLKNQLVNSLTEAVEKAEQVCLTTESLLEVATERFSELEGYFLSNYVLQYIDYGKYAHSLEIEGELVQFDFGHKTFVCTNARNLCPPGKQELS